MSDNTTFDYHGDAAGPTGTFSFEVQIDDYTIVIGKGAGFTTPKLTLTEVSRWDDKAQDWVDGTLDQAPDNWEQLVRDAQDAYDEAAYDRAHP